MEGQLGSQVSHPAESPNLAILSRRSLLYPASRIFEGPRQPCRKFRELRRGSNRIPIYDLTAVTAICVYLGFDLSWLFVIRFYCLALKYITSSIC